MNRAWASVGMAAALAGCVHYAPVPPRPERFAADLDARRLEARPGAAAWAGADLLSEALARNPRVLAAKADYLTALAASRGAKLSPGLSLTLLGEYAHESPRWGYGAALDVPIDAGDRRKTRVTTADLQALRAWYAYDEAVWAVRTALAKARVEIAAGDEDVAAAERALALRTERLLRLERRVAAGEDDRRLAVAAQAEVSSAERRLAEAESRRAQAHIALAKALGLAPAAVGSLKLEPVAENPDLGDLASWRGDAVQFRSDVLSAIADYDIAENALRLEVARQYPEVRIAPGYTYDHGVDKLPFGLTLSLPGMDLNKAAIDQAEAGRTAAGHRLEAVQAEAFAGVDAAVAALAAARADLDRTRTRDLPAARRAAAVAAHALSAGEGDEVDDLEARASEIDAELALLDARRASESATVDLEDALRRPFDPLEANVLRAALTRPGEAR